MIQLKSSGGIWTDHAKRQRNAVFLAYAREFLQAALKTGSPLVRAHLLGHALELMLKTYLLTEGFGERQLKKLGHNLSRALAESRVVGLEQVIHISAELETAVRDFNSVYITEAFRYFSILYFLSPPRLPDLRRLFRFARTLDRELKSRVRAA